MEVLSKLIKIANEDYQGHFTLMKFSGNWRCCFGTPSGDSRSCIYQMEEGATMVEAIDKTIKNNTCAYNFVEMTNDELFYQYKGGTFRRNKC